jgi:hypothetical protein
MLKIKKYAMPQDRTMTLNIKIHYQSIALVTEYKNLVNNNYNCINL